MPGTITNFWSRQSFLPRGNPAGRGKPVSAARFPHHTILCFHFLIEEATRLTVGAGHNRTALRQFAGRAFVHGKMEAVCREFKKSTPQSKALKPFWGTLNIPGNLDLQTVAENFSDLQESRHDADYNLSRLFTRQEAVTAVNQAKDAMDAMDAWRASQNS